MHGRLAWPALYQHADTGLHLVSDQNETEARPRSRRLPRPDGRSAFIDARKLGYMVDRVLRAFTDEATEKIVSTFHAWKRDKDAYEDIPGFCKSASLDEIAEHGYVLAPGRYVGAEEVEDDGVPFAEKMEGLTRELATQFHESEKLQSAIRHECQVYSVVGGTL